MLRYYYQGAPSWTWFYLYNFAPFTNDFENVGSMDIKFDEGRPFKPYEQLMGVFPASSRVHIPAPFHPLMTDDDSPIKDFYPETFEINMNGKRMAWQGIALLPFIDEKRLLDAMATRYPELSEDEVQQNGWGDNVLIASDTHPVYPALEALYSRRKSTDPVALNPAQSQGISGYILPEPGLIPGSTYPSPLVKEGMPDIAADNALAVRYIPRTEDPSPLCTTSRYEAPPARFDVRRCSAGLWRRRRPDYGSIHANMAGQQYMQY